MSFLRPGSRVPNRRPVPNPQTVSGYPQWNTYAALDCRATTKELNMAIGTSKGIARPPHKLDPRNLCHRMRPTDTFRTEMENAEERARVLSLRMDRLEGPKLDLCLGEWGRCVRTLIDNRQDAALRRLRDKERARGQVRIANACKFANIKL